MDSTKEASSEERNGVHGNFLPSAYFGKADLIQPYFYSASHIG
jgi:hypothetical protein